MKICLSIGKMDAAFSGMVETLQKYGDVDVFGLDGFSLSGYDIYIGKKMSDALLATADRLKAVFAYKTGVDDFPLKELAKKGISLYNSYVDSDIIAEYAFGLGISLVNRIAEFDKKMREGIWYDNENPYWESIFMMRVGLLGYGHIGGELHKILKRNHIEAYTLDRGKVYTDITAVKTLDSLFENTDLLVLSLPKTAETDNIIDAAALKKLSGKYIVNVGRSNAIDQAALFDSLKKQELRGAAIDTWDVKPKDTHTALYPSKYPFWLLPNIILSPHQAMRIQTGHARYVEDTTEKVILYIEGGEVPDKVDLERGY